MTMTVKTGVKNYADRKDFAPLQKTSNEKTQSAHDLEKTDGLDNILNQIADPNYIDPSKKLRTTGSKNLDKDAFMKLMLAQMKHQDPTNPMQSHEMAAQMAQFTSVEQLQNMNQTLGRMEASKKPGDNFQSLALIGKAVSGDSSLLSRLEGDEAHEFKYELPKNASNVKITIKNQNGEAIRTYSFQDLKQGQHQLNWNGQDERGLVQPAGEYKFQVEAIGGEGQKLVVKTDFEGIISGVTFSGSGPVLLVDGQNIKLSDVKKIVDPRLKNNDQNLEQKSAQDLKTEKALVENKPNMPFDLKLKNQGAGAAAAPAPANSGNLGELKMARDMIERLEKETGQETSL